MNWQSFKFTTIAFSTFALPLWANVCGTDYQSFNPTTNGLDFVTVQSSETLKPCIINFGAFVNYSKNTLTYSKDYTDSNNRVYKAGKKPNDELWGLDLGVGIGINERWDVGVSVPFVLEQNIEQKELNSNFKSTGATEIKLNTKYKLKGDDKSGIAVIGSINHNLIENNPFTGKDPKPSFNLEFAADKSINNWALAANIGYRWRNPGSPIEDVPFDTLGNQLIYSVASSYYFENLDTKIIFEIFGGHFFEETNEGSERTPDSLEWLVGAKHDISHNMALHFGGGTQLANALGSPESRAYIGINWALGPYCDKPESGAQNLQKVETMAAAPISPEIALPAVKEERLRYSAEILFDFDSDILKMDHIPEVDQYFDNLDRNKIVQIKVEGHTDSRGHPDYNTNLSQRRAESVKKYLLNKYKDIDSNKIQSIGYGASKPVADNANFQGRQKNRRVEFLIETK